jgi:hypothetical protein
MAQDDVGALVGLLGMVVGAIGLVSVLVPLKFLGIKSRGRGGLVLAAGAVFFIAGMIVVGTAQKSPTTVATASSSPAPAAAPKPATPPPPPKPAPPTLPADQVQFLGIVQAAQADYRAAANDMAKGGVRADRRGKLCALLKQPVVKDWVGTLDTQSSSNDGKGVLSVGIGKDVSLRTSNNSFSDTEVNTLIDPSSSVFKSAVALKRGDTVVVSGTFIGDKDDCIKESSLTLDGSLRQPAFFFRFSSIRKL